MIAVFLGPPGSGKGTQGALFQDKYDVLKISTGDLLRQEIKEQTAFGQKIQQIVESGGFISNDEIYPLIHKAILSQGKPIIFDGFPRNLEQGTFLTNLLDSRKVKDLKVIYFDISDDVVVERLSSRLVCGSCGSTYNIMTHPPKQLDYCDACGGHLLRRKDDEPDAVRYRLHVYHEQTAPLVSYYEQRGEVVRVKADEDPSFVFEEVESILFEPEKIRVVSDILP